jgi:hypothetical protein
MDMKSNAVLEVGDFVTYTLTLTVKRPVRIYDTEFTIEETAAWMVSAEAKRELEREVLKTLRKLDGDCDCEVMEVSVVNDEQSVADRYERIRQQDVFGSGDR